MVDSEREWQCQGVEKCSGSEAGSFLRLMDFVYHSTLGLRVIKKKVLPGETVGRKGINRCTL